MKFLVFSASNHSASINAILARFAADRLTSALQADADITLVDLNDYEMPIYSIDREKQDGIHPLAQEFFAKIGAADALIISYPEYNGSYTSAWKNIHDWMSRIDMAIYQNKPLLALSATPGPRSGAGVLGAVEASAPFFGADLRGKVGVGTWREAIDPDTGMLIREDDIAAIDAALRQLIQAEG
ncbi:MAG: NAD(P)H-dependent oxidoreductase [Pseudomonadota bacterium]